MVNPVGTKFYMAVGDRVYDCIITEANMSFYAGPCGGYNGFPDGIEMDVRIKMYPNDDIHVNTIDPNTALGQGLGRLSQIDNFALEAGDDTILEGEVEE